MIQILVVSHGLFAHGLINSAEMIIGKDENILSCALDAGEGVDGFKKALKRAFEGFLKSNLQVIILCDLYCGCPYTSVVEIAQSVFAEENYRIVSGANLPMMLELCLLNRRKHTTLDLLYKTAVSAGHEGIKPQPSKTNGCDPIEEL